VALLAFALVAAAVALGRSGAFDDWATAAVRSVASPLADRIAGLATFLASGPATLAIVAIVALVAVARGARRTAGVVAASWVASVALAQLLKALSGRERPSFPYTVAALPSPAFPSGHALNAVLVWGMLAIVAGRRFPPLRTAAVAAAGLVALLAGASRVYLGVHWPTDVLGGWTAGGALLALLSAALPPGSRQASDGTGPSALSPSSRRD
jgi:undecaprenyl-diphosphatase